MFQNLHVHFSMIFLFHNLYLMKIVKVAIKNNFFFNLVILGANI